MLEQPVELSFEQAIYTVLNAIPRGNVISYGGLAKQAGYPGRSRQVGRFLKLLPKGSKLPWYRVVNAQRKISFPKGSDKYAEQFNKLQQEGVLFKHERIVQEHFLG